MRPMEVQIETSTFQGRSTIPRINIYPLPDTQYYTLIESSERKFYNFSPILEPFLCDESCPYETERDCDDPSCARKIQNGHSYIPIRKDLVPYSWKKHFAGIAILIGITVVAAISVTVWLQDGNGDVLSSYHRDGIKGRKKFTRC